MHTLATITQIKSPHHRLMTEPLEDRTVNYRHFQTAIIGEVLLQAILLEVCCSPKPGLITPISTGAHRDMNLQTFLLSSSAIAPCFTLCAGAGFTHRNPLPLLLKKIRPIGIDYEHRLLTVTQGVNTQRGILFSGSVLASAAGYLHGQNQPVDCISLMHCVQQLCKGLCKSDFAALKTRAPRTAGELLFTKYGVTGIRGEAEQGFPTIAQIGYPALIAAFNKRLPLRHALVDCLLMLMTQCEDTNVLWRTGPQQLAELKLHASEIVHRGGISAPGGEARVHQLNEWCCQHRISPGGSADLLALSIAVYLLCHSHFPNDVTQERI
ncbi:triphosphoribosyl-dephospho-CoA synthase [Raoultella sp. BIGb0138]|uniref:triphosphoribosyl-dephospho-CoA synthase n=1 Tax=Raoultella sp. BIGb0138 TaxID=2485115 RepID=UPI0010EE4CA6|nr:triphosphoribosyl-dephospho-CoA synthase [Raoultella sp. BIGb0138]TCW08618.1 triphosphoribosyl-dephospho-CoA synthase [Raoultella sp. BIGb0138]